MVENFFKKIPYNMLIFFAVLMLLLPFTPMPHIVEKVLMLLEGTLKRPIDIFDLFYHLIPTFLLIAKVVIEKPWRQDKTSRGMG